MSLALQRMAGVLVGALLVMAMGCGSTDDEHAQGQPSGDGEGAAVETGAHGDDGTLAESQFGLETVSTPVPTPHPKGRKAPGFSLASLDGGSVSLSEHTGEVVLVDFWATWCGPCRRSIPHLVELQEEFRDRGFTIIGVSLDRGGQDPVRSFAERMNINYPVVMGSVEVAEAYGGVKFIPTAFLVDREGYIAKQITGLQPKETLRREILSVLDG